MSNLISTSTEVAESTYALTLDGERLVNKSLLKDVESTTRSLTFDIQSGTGYPVLNMERKTEVDVTCLFVNKEANQRKVLTLKFAVTPKDSVVDEHTVVKGKLWFDGTVALPQVSQPQMNSWYVLAVVGGAHNTTNDQVKFEASTDLNPVSAGESIEVDVPMASQFVRLSIHPQDPARLHTEKGNPLKLKPQGVFFTYTLVNETPFEVGIDNKLMIETNSLSNKGYYDLASINNSEVADGQRPIASHWIPTNTQENMSSLYRGEYKNKYYLSYTFRTSQLSMGKKGTVSNKFAGGKFFVAWMMPLNTSNVYAHFFVDGKVQDSNRTLFTSGQDANTFDLDGTNPATWKPNLKHLCVYGTAGRKLFDEQGKRFTVGMKMERPFLPIEYFAQSVVRDDTKNFSRALNKNSGFIHYNERGRDNGAWRYNGRYKLPTEDNVWSVVMNAYWRLPNTNIMNNPAWRGFYAWGGGYSQNVEGNNNKKYSHWGTTYMNENDSVFYAIRYLGEASNPISTDEYKPSEYYSASRYEYKWDRLIIEYIYLGKYYQTKGKATHILLASSDYWERMRRDYPELIIRRDIPFSGRYDDETYRVEDKNGIFHCWLENGYPDTQQIIPQHTSMAMAILNSKNAPARANPRISSLASPREMSIEVQGKMVNANGNVGGNTYDVSGYCVWPYLSMKAW